MSIQAQQILENALSLPAIDRAVMSSRLCRVSIIPMPKSMSLVGRGREWLAAYDVGQMSAIPVEEVFKEFDRL